MNCVVFGLYICFALCLLWCPEVAVSFVDWSNLGRLLICGRRQSSDSEAFYITIELWRLSKNAVIIVSHIRCQKNALVGLWKPGIVHLWSYVY
jgi:hypothetical protein